LAVLEQRNVAALRRRVAALAGEGLLQREPLPGLKESAGRPDQILSVSTAGEELLRARGVAFPARRRCDRSAPGFGVIAHQLLLNWFRIHLVDLPRRISGLSAEFAACERDAAASGMTFVPDGVFMLKRQDHPQNLLFLLEVDRGTESLGGSRSAEGSIREKIVNYQGFFREGGYKRYEAPWQCQFNGFRLLFLVETTLGLQALCRLVRALPPADFIWLTSRERLFAHGLAGAIWARGGRDAQPAESLLGPTLGCSAPLPCLAGQ
jgi:hypothetical protein